MSELFLTFPLVSPEEKAQCCSYNLENTNALIETTGFDFSPSIVLGTFSPFLH